jgi:MFS family permease
LISVEDGKASAPNHKELPTQLCGIGRIHKAILAACLTVPAIVWHKQKERFFSVMKISRTTVLLLSTAVVTMTSIGMSSFSLFLRPMESDFGWSRSMVTLPYMFAMLGWGAGAVLFGKLADDYGARRVILGGIVLMAAGFFGMSTSTDVWQLSLTYGLMTGMAMGACGLAIASLLVSQHYESKSRGLAVSVLQTSAPLSPLLFAAPLYFLINRFGWRAGALATAILLTAVALPLAWFGAREPEALSIQRSRLRWGACVPYLRNRSILVMFAARFSCGVAFFQIAHLVTLALSKGFTAATGAAAVSVFGAAAAASALLFGWLSDRYGRAPMLALSYVVRGVGTFFLSFEIPNELMFFILVAVAIGPTFGTVAVQNVMFYEIAGPRLAGVILGLSFIVHQIGSAGGPMLASIVFDRTGSYDAFMAVMALILLASGALIYSNTHRQTQFPELALGSSTARS